MTEPLVADSRGAGVWGCGHGESGGVGCLFPLLPALNASPDI